MKHDTQTPQPNAIENAMNEPREAFAGMPDTPATGDISFYEGADQF